MSIRGDFIPYVTSTGTVSLLEKLLSHNRMEESIVETQSPCEIKSPTKSKQNTRPAQRPILCDLLNLYLSYLHRKPVNNTECWTTTYQPRCGPELAGHPVVREVVSWLRGFHTDKPSNKKKTMTTPPKALVLIGDTGVGKTACVYACCSCMDFRVLEINSSEKRNGATVHSRYKEASKGGRSIDSNVQATNSQAALALLFDEVDTTFSDERGFLGGACKLMREAKCPVFFTTNSNLPELTTMEGVQCLYLDKIASQHKVFEISPQHQLQWLQTVPSSPTWCTHIFGTHVHLQLLLLSEGINTLQHPQCLSMLLKYFKGDMRRLVLNAQFWLSTVNSKPVGWDESLESSQSASWSAKDSSQLGPLDSQVSTETQQSSDTTPPITLEQLVPLLCNMKSATKLWAAVVNPDLIYPNQPVVAVAGKCVKPQVTKLYQLCRECTELGSDIYFHNIHTIIPPSIQRAFNCLKIDPEPIVLNDQPRYIYTTTTSTTPNINSSPFLSPVDSLTSARIDVMFTNTSTTPTVISVDEDKPDEVDSNSATQQTTQGSESGSTQPPCQQVPTSVNTVASPTHTTAPHVDSPPLSPLLIGQQPKAAKPPTPPATLLQTLRQTRTPPKRSNSGRCPTPEPEVIPETPPQSPVEQQQQPQPQQSQKEKGIMQFMVKRQLSLPTTPPPPTPPPPASPPVIVPTLPVSQAVEQTTTLTTPKKDKPTKLKSPARTKKGSKKEKAQEGITDAATTPNSNKTKPEKEKKKRKRAQLEQEEGEKENLVPEKDSKMCTDTKQQQEKTKRKRGKDAVEKQQKLQQAIVGAPIKKQKTGKKSELTEKDKVKKESKSSKDKSGKLDTKDKEERTEKGTKKQQRKNSNATDVTKAQLPPSDTKQLLSNSKKPKQKKDKEKDEEGKHKPEQSGGGLKQMTLFQNLNKAVVVEPPQQDKKKEPVKNPFSIAKALCGSGNNTCHGDDDPTPTTEVKTSTETWFGAQPTESGSANMETEDASDETNMTSSPSLQACTAAEHSQVASKTHIVDRLYGEVYTASQTFDDGRRSGETVGEHQKKKKKRKTENSVEETPESPRVTRSKSKSARIEAQANVQVAEEKQKEPTKSKKKKKDKKQNKEKKEKKEKTSKRARKDDERDNSTEKSVPKEDDSSKTDKSEKTGKKPKNPKKKRRKEIVIGSGDDDVADTNSENNTRTKELPTPPRRLQRKCSQSKKYDMNQFSDSSSSSIDTTGWIETRLPKKSRKKVDPTNQKMITSFLSEEGRLLRLAEIEALEKAEKSAHIYTHQRATHPIRDNCLHILHSLSTYSTSLSKIDATCDGLLSRARTVNMLSYHDARIPPNLEALTNVGGALASSNINTSGVNTNTSTSSTTTSVAPLDADCSGGGKLTADWDEELQHLPYISHPFPIIAYHHFTQSLASSILKKQMQHHAQQCDEKLKDETRDTEITEEKHVEAAEDEHDHTTTNPYTTPRFNKLLSHGTWSNRQLHPMLEMSCEGVGMRVVHWNSCVPNTHPLRQKSELFRKLTPNATANTPSTGLMSSTVYNMLLHSYYLSSGSRTFSEWISMLSTIITGEERRRLSGKARKFHHHLHYFIQNQDTLKYLERYSPA